MKHIKINDIDVSEYSLPYTDYSVDYAKISGQYGGFSLAGTEIEDTIAVKAQIKWPIRPLAQAEASKLSHIMRQNKYAMIEYYDPHEGAYRTVEAIYTPPSFKCRVDLPGGDMWFSDPLTFRER